MVTLLDSRKNDRQLSKVFLTLEKYIYSHISMLCTACIIVQQRILVIDVCMSMCKYLGKCTTFIWLKFRFAVFYIVLSAIIWNTLLINPACVCECLSKWSVYLAGNCQCIFWWESFISVPHNRNSGYHHHSHVRVIADWLPWNCFRTQCKYI